MKPKPNLFIAGAPKCATTSIANYLKTHPEIFHSNIKEPHYFADDFDEFRTVNSLSDYLQLYADADKQKYRCDASVWYLYSNKALKNIHQFNPDARIIAILRNPLEMLPSLHHQLYYTLDEDVLSFEEAWNLQQERKAGKNIPESCREPLFLQYKDVVNYASQLQRVYNYFPKEQVQVIIFDDLKTNPAAVYRDILAFLDLEHDGRNEFPKENTRKTYRSKSLSRIIHRPPKLFNLLARGIKKITGISHLKVRKRIKYFNERKVSKAPLSDHFKKDLLDQLRPSITELESLLNIDLKHWKHLHH